MGEKTGIRPPVVAVPGGIEMTEELDEQAVIGTMLFVQSKSTRELAEFILFLQGAVDGLTKNNKSFVDSYRKMADRQEENKKLRARVDALKEDAERMTIFTYPVQSPSFIGVSKPGEYQEALKKHLALMKELEEK